MLELVWVALDMLCYAFAQTGIYFMPSADGIGVAISLHHELLDNGLFLVSSVLR